MSILQQIPSKCTLRRELKQAVFGSRVRCPHCLSRQIRLIKQEERWRCRRCHKPFSITSCCWLKGAKLSLETIWLLLWCWQREVPLKQTTAIVGISYPTVYRYFSLFRDHIPPERLEPPLLSNQVAVDEAFTKDHCIMGAKEKGTRNIALRVLEVKDPSKHDAILFLTRYVVPGTHVCTDGSRIYRGIEKWHHLTHSYELHKKFEFTLTAEIEGLWGVFRTFVRRMYHHVTKYKLKQTVAEFCLRFRQDKIFQSPYEYWRLCLSPQPFAL